MMIRFRYFILLLLVNFQIIAQTSTTLTEINKDIWEPFTKSFETSDYELFSSLHSNELIRVNADGNRLLTKEPYIDGYKNRWKNTNLKRTISFRFIERIFDENNASERGIYKLTINPNSEQEQSFYGKFHVILTKENNQWKILVDYDSSENNTIDEKSYLSANPIDAD